MYIDQGIAAMACLMQGIENYGEQTSNLIVAFRCKADHAYSAVVLGAGSGDGRTALQVLEASGDIACIQEEELRHISGRAGGSHDLERKEDAVVIDGQSCFLESMAGQPS